VSAPEPADCRHEHSPSSSRSDPHAAFAGFCFPQDVIVLAVRWYLRFGLSYRDLEELRAERGIKVDHVTVYRWGDAIHAQLAEAARPNRHSVGSLWGCANSMPQFTDTAGLIALAWSSFADGLLSFCWRHRPLPVARS
jgi:hypothetical protein